jgi:tRNA(Arg) A34 adenosine deaminase TadA
MPEHQKRRVFMPANPAFMQMAIDLATENVTSGAGGPFGAVVVRAGEVIATGVNCVTANNDPTAHAEVMAIREACRVLGDFQLTGCEVYTSCEPCPMCLAAIYWSRCAAIFFGNTAADAAKAGFDDSFLYTEVKKPIEDRAIPTAQLLPEQAIVSFNTWCERAERIDY